MEPTLPMKRSRLFAGGFRGGDDRHGHGAGDLGSDLGLVAGAGEGDAAGQKRENGPRGFAPGDQRSLEQPFRDGFDQPEHLRLVSGFGFLSGARHLRSEALQGTAVLQIDVRLKPM